MMKRTMNDMVPGDRMTIISIEVEGSGRKRLMEMGLSPGTAVQMLRRAPLGDPVEYKVRGYLISLRKAEADRIFVEARQ